MIVHARGIVVIFGVLLSVVYSEETVGQKTQEVPRARWEENVQDTE